MSSMSPVCTISFRLRSFINGSVHIILVTVCLLQAVIVLCTLEMDNIILGDSIEEVYCAMSRSN